MGEREATFAFIDLSGFTALTEVHGDQHAVALLERFEELTRAALTDSDRVVKTIGDAVMLVFGSPLAAVDATIRIFDACAAEPGLPVPRAGLHRGLAIERSGDYFGATVNLTARVADQAHGGQVLATRSVADAARTRDVPVVDLGSFSLRNLAAPVELFELGICLIAAGAAVDPVCRMQVDRTRAAGRLRYLDVDHWFCSLRCVAAFATDPAQYIASSKERRPSPEV